MESATLAPTGGGSGFQVEDKSLKKNAISCVSNLVISVASVAPGYSLAATLGFIAAVPALVGDRRRNARREPAPWRAHRLDPAQVDAQLQLPGSRRTGRPGLTRR
jgi:hypothetical protein